VTPALWRIRQEDGKFQVHLGYTVRPYLKIKKTGPEAWLKQQSDYLASVKP
jgi:hypothetical protein